jgi:hypothetical protein
VHKCGNALGEIEEKKIEEMNELIPKRLYYSLDNHNIFKRHDRYYYKKTLMASFAFLCAYNISEIILNIVILLVYDKSSANYEYYQRILPLMLNMIHIIVIQFLASITVVKLKIKTYIYY